MKKLVFSILLVLQSFFVFAQETSSITGKIIDSKSQKALQSIVVSVQNSTIIRVTNEQGLFTIDNVPLGEHLILIRSSGYTQQLIKVEVIAGQVLDLGLISLEEDITSEQQLSLVTITETDLGDDNSGSENTAGLLQASRDAFQQVSAFNWGQARFRIRGLDNEYGVTMINGVIMNKIYDGRPQWNNWGGLNDATRNQEFTMGSGASDHTFGGILGTQQIYTRASIYRPGTRVSFSGTNTNYSWRMMGTHASGMNENGWAFVISASRRFAEEGYFEGSDYSANSVFASVEKKINNKHSLNFMSIYAQNSRGKNSPNSNEVNSIAGEKYNSYWGYQDGKKRNSRDKDLEEPILMLSHYWTISPKTKLNTNLTYQFGSVANSRLDYQDVTNPDPTYYRNLPSYFTSLYNNNVDEVLQQNPGAYQPGGLGGLYTPDLVGAANANFFTQRQIDWNAMYQANSTAIIGADGQEIGREKARSKYVLYQDRMDDKTFTFNTVLNTQLSDNVNMNAGATYRRLKSNSYQYLEDLLGGLYYDDIDNFLDGDASQADLNNPDRKVVVGDKYGYNYNLHANVIDAFTQFKFTYNKVDFYMAQEFVRSEYQREGLYKNGIYPTTSYGYSRKLAFDNFGFKGGLTYKLTGRHLLTFNAAYMTKAPSLRNAFPNARLNNFIFDGLESETISSADLSYVIRAPKLKARITGYYSKIQDATETSFFYAEGAFEEAFGDGGDAFVAELVTGIDKLQIGGELGLEYQVTQTIKATGAIAYGQYTYTSNPNVALNRDENAVNNIPTLVDYGSSKLKDYRVPGSPQQAYSLGLEYRDPKFWWIGANINHLADNYLDVTALMRTDNFYKNPADISGYPFPEATEERGRELLKQEKFDSFTLVNLVGGKSWRISKKNRNTIGFFASINNVFDVTYKTGGFEQARNANYRELNQDITSGTPSFAPKYFYGYGRTYFINLYINL
ncbi:carboxypeptidase-like regulatory domain-containing protein [Flavobacterium sp.]|uniref:carboxypeptidase-like regulatory domain-containing protein n=1 Tax=Flavobacterium sp. TaxID=239 RepID=UPI002632B92A|nr:carboxypeptidase-like regulatory domain-containing protein [Flavobacterium sp.]MDD2984973.1 carboxypeptidase-like regulatory domain-containing protein [Flavobacterium sp.]